MKLPSVTVTQLNQHIKTLFDADPVFSSVIVSGEISNFSPHYKTGHLYFSLKDETSAIKAVMFAAQAKRLRFLPENGMKVYALGRVSVFERDGVYQLYVNELIRDGEGALAAAFRQLKERLEKKGLFDPAHKKPLPAFPKKIGIITSPGGAALQDMLNILRRRYPLAQVVLAGVTVQGPGAASEIIGALREMNARPDIDVIIVGRGGGSAEDLWCFNEELLAQAVYESRIPVVSAVGHETDFTICDFVSDVRAPTPSAAAELVVPDMRDLRRKNELLTEALYAAYRQKLSAVRGRLAALTALRDFTDPGRFFEADRQKLSALNGALTAGIEKRLLTSGERQARLKQTLSDAVRRQLNDKKLSFAKQYTALEKLNPLSVLLRGYAIIETEDGRPADASTLTVDETVRIEMRDGNAKARILEIQRRERNAGTDL